MSNSFGHLKTYKIAAIPADGIGPEVIASGLEVLQALASREGTFEMAVQHFDQGSDYCKVHGKMMPEEGPTLLWAKLPLPKD